jgi:hypothetical protein
MPKPIYKSRVLIVGDVTEIVGRQITVLTKSPDSKGTIHEDLHPVILNDDQLVKVKVGNKVGFKGIIRRFGNRTKLQPYPDHFSTKQADLKPIGYKNEAGLSGHVVFKNFLGTQGKQPTLTIGIGDPDPSKRGTALYGSIWRNEAKDWNVLLRGCQAVVQLVGYMRSRIMTGASAGDTMYELIGVRDMCKILSREPIKTGFEDYNDEAAEALMALEFDDIPDDGRVSTVPVSDDAPADEAIPF